jgi:hypothetical protein
MIYKDSGVKFKHSAAQIPATAGASSQNLFIIIIRFIRYDAASEIKLFGCNNYLNNTTK